MRKLHKTCLVLEDGAPAHKGPHVRRVRASVTYENLPHPGNSPDLNAIEHVWRKLKAQIKKRYAEIVTVKDLMKVAQEEWANLDQKYIDNLIDTMPKRWEALRAAKGLYTPY